MVLANYESVLDNRKVIHSWKALIESSNKSVYIQKRSYFHTDQTTPGSFQVLRTSLLRGSGNTDKLSDHSGKGPGNLSYNLVTGTIEP